MEGILILGHVLARVGWSGIVQGCPSPWVEGQPILFGLDASGATEHLTLMNDHIVVTGLDLGPYTFAMALTMT